MNCTLGYNHGMALPHQNINLNGYREALNKQLTTAPTHVVRIRLVAVGKQQSKEASAGLASKSIKYNLKCAFFISYLKIRNSKYYVNVNLKSFLYSFQEKKVNMGFVTTGRYC